MAAQLGGRDFERVECVDGGSGERACVGGWRAAV
jgi:hypothetical protein